jgi:hypothetical protein
MSNLGQLTLDLVARIGSFTGPLDKAERASKKNADAISRHHREINSAISSSLKPLAKWSAGFLSVSGIVSFTKKSFEAAGAIKDVAATAGITTDTLQEMRHAATLNGVSIEELDSGMQKLNKNMGDLRAGSGSLYSYLNKTDKALLSQVKSAGSTDQALDMIFKSMKGLESQADRSALSVAAFGRSGQRLSLVTDEYQSLREEAKSLGLVIDEDLINSAEEAGDKFDTMSKVINTQLTAAFLNLSPAVVSVSQGLLNVTTALSGLFKKSEDNGRMVDLERLKKDIELFELALNDAEKTGKKTFGVISTEGMFFEQTIDQGKKSVDDLKSSYEKLSKIQGGNINTNGRGTNPSTAPTIIADPEDDGSWGNLEKVIKRTNEVTKQRIEIEKKSNDAILAERERQLQEDIARDNNYRQLIEQADLAELNNKYSGVELELKLHEYKYDKLRGLYEEGSVELSEIERAATAERITIEKSSLEEREDYWKNYLESFENSMSDMDSIVGDSLNSWTSQFGNFFASAILDSENLEDAFKTLGMGMVNTVVSAIGQMIAQWLVYKTTKALVDKSTQTAAMPAMVANAQAASLQAGINAYASAAAIPIVGFAAAPGAMAAALATTGPMAAAIAALSFAGMAHDGIDSVPETGTWLLKKGERVVTADTSQKLDNTLSRLSNETGTNYTQSKYTGNNSGATKEAHYHYHSEGPTFLNRAQFKDAARMLMSEIENEATRRGTNV